MNYERAKYIFDYALTQNFNVEYSINLSENMSFGYSGVVNNSYYPTVYNKSSAASSYYSDTYINLFVDNFNQKNSSSNNLGVENYIFIVCYEPQLNIYALPSNNTIGNNAPHLRLFNVSNNGSNYSLQLGFYDGNFGTLKGLKFTFNANSTRVSVNEIDNSLFPFYFKYYKGNYNTFVSWNSSDTVYYSPFNIISLVNATFYGPSDINSISTLNNCNTPYILKTFYSEHSEPEPEEPSGDISGESTTGQITNSSGEITGSINLQPIENTLGRIEDKIPTSGDIQNIISGETTKITNTITEPANFDNKNICSGDIIGGLNFMADPYDNFWLSMTNGLHTALLGTVRQLPVDWLGYQGYFNLDGLINYPTPLKNILTTVSTVAMVWLLVKWWKIIIDKLTGGDMDEVLAMNEEERHS